MSQENTDVVRAIVRAIARRDFAGAGSRFDPRAEWHNTSSFPGPALCTGVDAIVEHWRTLFEDFDLDGMEIEEVTAVGDSVVVRLHTSGRGRASGAPIDTRWASLYRFRGGKVVRVDVFGDYGRALAASTVDRIRSGYEAFSRRDLDAALEMTDPEIEAHDPAEMPDAATHRGREAVRRDWEATLDLFDDFTIDIEEIFDAGEEVVLFLHYSGRGKESGAVVEAKMAHVLTIRDGLAIRLRQYLDRGEALRAAGLPEP